MAYLIPENASNNKGVSLQHRRVARALTVGLDDEVTVWFEPPFDGAGERPDFVVLDPSTGVVVVAVFEQAEGQDVLGAIRGTLRVDDNGTERQVENPLARANRFGSALQGAISSTPSVAGVPVGGLAAFPYLSRAQAEHLGLDTEVAPEHSLFKEDIATISGGQGDGLLLNHVQRVLEGGVGEPLTDEQQDRLRGLIHPEIVIAAQPEQPSLFVNRPDTRTDTFRVMDRTQERFAKGLGSGHRIVRGVAGSGKTLILVSRARLLSRLYPGQRILVTCYTRALASVLRAQLAECPNVDVMNIDALMARTIRAAGLEHPGYGKGGEAVSAAAVKALELRPPERYRAVLVDEAQDLDTDALRFCAQLAEPRGDDDGDLLIVADSAQNIFRRKFSWSDAGIKAQGRTSILRKNYRNTREILQFSYDFLVADADLESDELPDLDDEVTIIPAEAAERSGPEPEIEIVANLELELERVLDTVAERYAPNLPARSIAVLMVDHHVDERGRRIAEGLERRGLPAFWVTDPSNMNNRDDAGMADEPIIVSTVHSAKGLEFPSVIMCGLGGRHGAGDGLFTERKTVYVGFTRALDELTVITTTDNAFAADFARESAATG